MKGKNVFALVKEVCLAAIEKFEFFLGFKIFIKKLKD